MRVRHEPLDEDFTVHILAVELTGDLAHLTCRTGLTDLIAIVSPELRVAPGDTLHIPKIHLLDASTAQAIRPMLRYRPGSSRTAPDRRAYRRMIAARSRIPTPTGPSLLQRCESAPIDIAVATDIVGTRRRNPIIPAEFGLE